jgi:putative addiction module antidote
MNHAAFYRPPDGTVIHPTQLELRRFRDGSVECDLRQAGGSVSATLPKDMADRLRLEAGDRILAVETDRGILLTPYDPETERALKIAAKAAKRYRHALRELAK